jgi:hypothetical protein
VRKQAVDQQLFWTYFLNFYTEINTPQQDFSYNSNIDSPYWVTGMKKLRVIILLTVLRIRTIYDQIRIQIQIRLLKSAIGSDSDTILALENFVRTFFNLRFFFA